MEIYRGPSEYRRLLDQWLDAFPDAHLEARETRVAGEFLLVIVDQVTRGRGSGVPIEFA